MGYSRRTSFAAGLSNTIRYPSAQKKKLFDTE
jgi:hypothetical protein